MAHYYISIHTRGIHSDVLNIKRCNSFEEAIAIKNNLLQQGKVPNQELYYELIYKCDNYEQAIKLAAEMGNEGILPSVKLYYLLIKKAGFQQDVLFLFDKLKEFYLTPDSRIANIVASKLKGTETYYKFAHLKYFLKSIEELIPTIHGAESAIQIAEILEDHDININIEVLNLMLGKVNSVETIEVVLNIIKENNLFMNDETYMNLLRKSIELGAVNRFYEMLNEIDSQLDDKQHKKLHCAFMSNSSIVGGMGKYLISKENVINNLKVEIKKHMNLYDITYLLGVVTGLEDAGRDFLSVKKDALGLFEELRSEDDYELNKYDIRNAEGILDGIDKAQNIYENIKVRQHPLKIIAFISDIDTLNKLNYLAIRSFFYKTSLSNINDFQVNSFNFTDSINEFYEMITAVDYEKYDVSITIVSDYESKEFIEQYKNMSPVFGYFDNILIAKVCNVRYIKITKHYNTYAENIFKKMYKYNSMNSIKLLV